MQRTRSRSSSTIPFGWKLHEDNSSLLVEVPEEMDTVDYVRELYGKVSLRKIAAVILARHGRNMSPRGIDKLIFRSY